MLFTDLPAWIAAKFVPAPDEVTPELAQFIRARFGRDAALTIDERIAINSIASLASTRRSVYAARVRGVFNYRRCEGCNRYFGEDEDFVGDVDRCQACYDNEGYHYCEGCGDYETSSCEKCDRCDSCCRCSRCSSCNRVDENLCGNCNCCERHCDGCRSCDRCGEYDDSVCGDCDRCDSCGHGNNCDSNDETDDREVTFTPKTWPATGKQKQFDCTRLLGCEVEYVSSSDFDPLSGWAKQWGASIVYDGSCGWECVTSPAAGDNAVKQLQSLASALSSASAEHNNDCGIHVHVDARDLRWADILRLAKVYAKVEPFLYLIGGQKRANNRYCEPIGRDFADALAQEDPKGALLEVVYPSETAGRGGGRDYLKSRHRPGKKEGDSLGDGRSWGRYRGLNLLPWIAGRSGHVARLDTTVEFRLHREYTNAERLIGWAKLCARIVDYAAKATDAEVDALPRSAARALTVIAPDLAGWIVKRIQDYRKACRWYTRTIGYQAGIGYSIGKQPKYSPWRTYYQRTA